MRKDEKEINQIYNCSAEIYYKKRSRGSFPNKFVINPSLYSIIGDVRDLKILDIGCGFGEDLIYLKENGANVSGIDINSEILKIAKENPKLVDVELNLGSIYNLNFREKFDMCIANMVLDQVEDLDTAFKEVNKVLGINGTFLISISHPLNSATGNYEQKLKSYFKIQKKYFSTSKFKKKIPYYFRNFQQYSKSIKNSGFLIEEIIEPRPIKKALDIHPEKYKKYSRLPLILIMKLRKI